MNKKSVDLKEMYPIIKEVVDSGGEFELYPRGTSMLPLIRQGEDSVTIVSADNLKKGDIAFYIRDDSHFVLHRIVKIKKDIFTMCGDNQFVCEKGIRKEQIFAKVSYITRDGKTIDEDNKKYIKYVKSLPRVRFKRRIRNFLGKVKRKIFKNT